MNLEQHLGFEARHIAIGLLERQANQNTVPRTVHHVAKATIGEHGRSKHRV